MKLPEEIATEIESLLGGLAPGAKEYERKWYRRIARRVAEDCAARLQDTSDTARVNNLPSMSTAYGNAAGLIRRVYRLEQADGREQ